VGEAQDWIAYSLELEDPFWNGCYLHGHNWIPEVDDPVPGGNTGQLLASRSRPTASGPKYWSSSADIGGTDRAQL